MGETWKDVPGYEWGYEVSDLGSVRSKTRTLQDGRVFKGRLLKPWDHAGYRVITFPGNNKISVHRLVCQTFHGAAPKDKPFALHRNGVRDDNRAENLYWGDYVDNVADALEHGTHTRYNAMKTHCPQGHEYTEDNTYIRPQGTDRQCRECMRVAARKYQLKLRAKKGTL